eukprot:scaffold21704_cov65-Phaeocystis_antarctica.AAC.1
MHEWVVGTEELAGGHRCECVVDVTAVDPARVSRHAPVLTCHVRRGNVPPCGVQPCARRECRGDDVGVGVHLVRVRVRVTLRVRVSGQWRRVTVRSGSGSALGLGSGLGRRCAPRSPRGNRRSGGAAAAARSRGRTGRASSPPG